MEKGIGRHGKMLTKIGSLSFFWRGNATSDSDNGAPDMQAV
jgi:hypothetical protein